MHCPGGTVPEVGGNTNPNLWEPGQNDKKVPLSGQLAAAAGKLAAAAGVLGLINVVDVCSWIRVTECYIIFDFH